MKWLLYIFLSVVSLSAFLLSSCKKEQSCESCIERNLPPKAVAGPDQTISFPQSNASLDGSKSNDSDGTITKWNWTKISGPASFSFDAQDSAKTNVQNLVPGVYQFILTVTDNNKASDRDTIQVTVVNNNQPPVACAGADQAITLPENAVVLDGSCSNDPDLNITNYSWTKISGPSSYRISIITAAKIQVTYLTEGVYQFELNVTDAGGLVSYDTVQVIVKQSNELVHVYIAGEENGMAKYWKNGQPVSLPSSMEVAVARSIAVVGNDVYVAGAELEFLGSNNRACYWKNGKQVYLTGHTGSEANAIAVIAGDVYVTGTESGRAIYWKNEQAVPLSTMMSFAYSIAVVNNDVYVAGSENSDGSKLSAVYWKNGKAVQLSNGSFALSIAVNNNDVHVAGYDEPTGTWALAKHWKNGQETTLKDRLIHSAATSVFIHGSDIYITGYNESKAVYWKNGKLYTLTDGSNYASAQAISVFGSDVYVAGYEMLPNGVKVAKYWKNGLAIPLTDGRSSARANSIFLVPR